LVPPLGFQQRGKISHPITRALIAALAARPARHRQIFSFLMMVLALLPNALKLFPTPDRNCFAFLPKIRLKAFTSGGLMRYISSGVWYGLHVACNNAFLFKLL
jgi:hypothetical protein